MEERSRVIQTIMEMDCIPSGMELFPAMDEEQFEFIKHVIDDCDYYLLIIGGRYGSVSPEGVSYTEMEYDYAVQRGMKVIALLHKQPDEIPAKKTDQNSALASRLNDFRTKVQTNRLVKFWKNADELPGLVALSLQKTIRAYPSAGWVRGGTTATIEILEELNNARKQIEELRAQLAQSTSTDNLIIADIAGLDEILYLEGTYAPSLVDESRGWSASLEFGEIFSLIAPHLLAHPYDQNVKSSLAEAILSRLGIKNMRHSIKDNIYQVIKIQLRSLGLINLDQVRHEKGGTMLFWSLTKKGEAVMAELVTIRKQTIP